MRGLCRLRLGRSLAVLTGLAMLSVGCGDTGGADRLVFQLTGFNGDSLRQADAVRSTGADVDVFQGVCGTAQSLTPEPFTQTLINAVFENQQASDIRVEGYTVHVNDSRIGLGDSSGTITGTVQGGRCSSQVDRSCANDDDCVQGTTIGTCTHQSTTISSIVLFDIAAKLQVSGQPELWGQALPVTITFLASDANQSFQTRGSYLVTFGNFDNCSSTSTGA